MTDTPHMSHAIGALAAALAKAQAELEGAKKDAVNPHFRSKYADLASVWEAWQAVGPKHGLAIVQTMEPAAANGVTLRTTLMHTSGEWVSGVLFVPASKNDAQGFGSATTYARRYALAAMVGIAPEDDDGNAAAASAPKPRTQRQPAPPKEPTPQDRADNVSGDNPMLMSYAEVEAVLREQATGGMAALTKAIAKVRPDVHAWPKGDQAKLVQLRETELIPTAKEIDVMATAETAGAKT